MTRRGCLAGDIRSCWCLTDKIAARSKLGQRTGLACWAYIMETYGWWSDEPEVDLAGAVARLRAGGVVAFPTETVYGLGADAVRSPWRSAGVRAQGPAEHNPLIVHVSGPEMARGVARGWSDQADAARMFWPGPLTLAAAAGGGGARR